MSNKSTVFILLVFLILIVAVAVTAGARDACTGNKLQQQGTKHVCPMKLEDTSVEVSDSPDGVALVFVTKTGDVDELRRRVRAMETMHNKRHAEGESVEDKCSKCKRGDTSGSHEQEKMSETHQGSAEKKMMHDKHNAGEKSAEETSGMHQHGDTSGSHEQEKMSETHQESAEKGMMHKRDSSEMHASEHSDMSEHMHGEMMMPAAIVRAEDVPGGASLIFAPVNSSDLDDLRKYVRDHVGNLQDGECPKMKMSCGSGMDHTKGTASDADDKTEEKHEEHH